MLLQWTRTLTVCVCVRGSMYVFLKVHLVDRGGRCIHARPPATASGHFSCLHLLYFFAFFSFSLHLLLDECISTNSITYLVHTGMIKLLLLGKTWIAALLGECNFFFLPLFRSRLCLVESRMYSHRSSHNSRLVLFYSLQSGLCACFCLSFHMSTRILKWRQQQQVVCLNPTFTFAHHLLYLSVSVCVCNLFSYFLFSCLYRGLTCYSYK